MMTLALIFLAMVLAVVTILLWPLLRQPKAVPTDGEAEIYREQLAEVARDVENDMLTAAEADVVRAEIFHRMLAAEKKHEEKKQEKKKIGNMFAACLVLHLAKKLFAECICLTLSKGVMSLIHTPPVAPSHWSSPLP